MTWLDWLLTWREPPSFELGPLTIHAFGILVALGFVVGTEAARRKATRVGLDPDLISRLVGYLVVGALVGGHLGHAVLYEPAHYLANPIELLYVWDGLSSFGGLATCAALAVWFFRRERAPLLPYLDCLSYGLTLGWGVGRLGCFVAHDHPGIETTAWIGVLGNCPDPVTGARGVDMAARCHDLGLYEALYAFAVFSLFLVLDRRPRHAGFFTAMLPAVYAPVRFALDALRHPDTDARAFGLTPAQYLSIGLFVLGLVLLRRWRHEPAPHPVVPDHRNPT